MPTGEFHQGQTHKPATHVSSVIVGDSYQWQEMPMDAAVKAKIKLGDKVVLNIHGLLVPITSLSDAPAYTVIGFQVPKNPDEAGMMMKTLEDANPAPVMIRQEEEELQEYKPRKKPGWEFLGAP